MIVWTVETLNKDVDDELESLAFDMRSRFVRVANLIKEFGPFKVGMPHIRSLGNKLWEIRVGGRDGIGRRMTKTSPKAIKIALERAKEAGLL